jgi:dimethylargininase
VSLVALTRAVSAAIARCELVHLERRPIDVDLAREQHRVYEAALRGAGCEVRTLPADPSLPDSVFVEDTAVVLDEVAVIARPGAESRRAETEPVARTLAEYRPLFRITAPATLDGGDVLPIGRTVYVGERGRTNRAGIEQLAAAVVPHGYDVRSVPVRGCLHLKSAVTLVAPGTVLCNPRWVNPAAFAGMGILEVAAEEPGAANGLLVGERLIYPSSFPATARRLAAQGIDLLSLNVSELQKAEGAVTCCAILIGSPRFPRVPFRPSPCNP